MLQLFMISWKTYRKSNFFFLMQMQNTQNFIVKNFLNDCNFFF